MVSKMETEDSLCNIEQRHKKEKKDLQAKIQSLKKSVSKGDKKKKKEILDQIIKLETDLEAKHLSELTITNKNNDDESNEQNTEGSETSDVTRISKAQKRRNKKTVQEKTRMEMILKQEEENVNGPRNLETQAIRKFLSEKNLGIHIIPSNGDCLYGAISHQLNLIKNDCKTVRDLRHLTSQHIRLNKNVFLPFLTNSETDDMLNDDEYEVYCDKIEKTNCWGGQVELQALSEILKIPIHVVQSTPPYIIIQGHQYTGDALIITYHRHMYGLGEHYNSTKKMEGTDSDSN